MLLTWCTEFDNGTVDGDTSISFDSTKCHVVPRAVVDSLFRRFHLHWSASEVSVQVQMTIEDLEGEEILLQKGNHVLLLPSELKIVTLQLS